MDDRQKTTILLLKGLMLKSLPGMITCVEFEQFIVDYLEDTLPASKRKLFERHLNVCRECKEYLAGYQLTKTLYTKKIHLDNEFTPEEVPQDLIAAIIAASSLNNKE